MIIIEALHIATMWRPLLQCRGTHIIVLEDKLPSCIALNYYYAKVLS